MNFKNFFFAMMMTFIAYSTPYAQTHVTVTSEVHAEHEETTPLIEVHADGRIKGSVGWTAAGLLSKHERKAYAGLTYSPKKSIQFSASAGVETHKHHQSPIAVISLKWKKERWSFLHDSKIGDSYKTKNVLKRHIASGFTVGAYGKTNFGIGPYAEKKLGEHFSLFGAMGFGYDPKGILGLKYHFEF